MSVLEKDNLNSNEFPSDYDTDLENEWSRFNSLDNPEQIRNIFYQKQLANHVQFEINRMNNLLRNILNIHLNIGQQFSLDRSQISALFRIFSTEFHSNSQMKFSLDFTDNTKMFFQSMMKSLASADQIQSESITNLSRSISISFFNQNQTEILVQSSQTNVVEFFIPRDPNLNRPLKVLQNVTSLNSTEHNQYFYLHFVNLTNQKSFSLHVEIYPLNLTRTYLFIYKFDRMPILNQSINEIDGWTIFCPESKSLRSNRTI